LSLFYIKTGVFETGNFHFMEGMPVKKKKKSKNNISPDS